MDFQLPRLADSLVESTVSRWLKKAGDEVHKGEPLVEIETDKVNAELESPIDGVLSEIVVPEALDARPEADVRRARHLCLHAHQPLDGLRRCQVGTAQQHLPRKQRAIERPPAEHAGISCS